MKTPILILVAIPLAAQSLPTLVDEALAHNPEIVAAKQRYAAARLRPTQAGALPDPTVSLGYSSNGGPWPLAGIGREPTSNLGVSITQEMPFPGKRKLRAAIADTDADAELRQYEAVRLSVASRLKQAYHELHHAIVAAEYVRKDQAILADILRITEARYTTGHAAQQDVFKAQAQYAIFETQAVRFEQERVAKEAAILALLNRPPGGHIEVSDEMAPGELTVTLDELLAAAKTDSPVLARERRMIDRARLETNLAVKDKLPDYALSGGYFNQGSMPPMWQFRVDVKLPVWHKQKQDFAIREREASELEAEGSADAIRRSLESGIQQEYAAAVDRAQAHLALRRFRDPAKQAGARILARRYRAGSLDFLALFSNFMTTVDYELMYHEEIMRLHLAMARLEELSGREL